MSSHGFRQGQYNYHDQIPHDWASQYYADVNRYSPPHQMQGPYVPAVAPVQQPSPRVVCEVCEVSFPRKNLVEHRNGKRHRRNLQQQIEELMRSKTSKGQESIRAPNSQMNPVVQPKQILKSKKNGCTAEDVSLKGPFFNLKYKEVLAEGSERKLRDNTGAKDHGLNVEKVSFETPRFKNKKVPAEVSERKLRDNTAAKNCGFKRKIGEATEGEYLQINNEIKKPVKSLKPEVSSLSNSAKSLVQVRELIPPSKPMASPVTGPTPLLGSSQFQHVSASLAQVSKDKEHHEIQNLAVETNDQPQSTPVELPAPVGSNNSAGTEDMSCDFAAITIAPPQGPMTQAAVGSSGEPKNQIDSQTEASEGKEHHEIQNPSVETNGQQQSIPMELHAPAGSDIGTLIEHTSSDSFPIAPPQGLVASEVCTLLAAVGSSFEPKIQPVLLTEMSEGKDYNEIQNQTVVSNDQPQSTSVKLHGPAGSNIGSQTEGVDSDSTAVEIAPLAFAPLQAVASNFRPQVEHVLLTEIEPQVSEAIEYSESQHPTKETDIQFQPSVFMEFDAPSGDSTNTQTSDGNAIAEAEMDVSATELGITQLPQVSVCLKCGDKGFLEALVFCDKCQVYALHRYCLDGPVIFTDDITWFCEDCKADEANTDSHDQCALVPFKTIDSINLKNDASQAITDLTNSDQQHNSGAEEEVLTNCQSPSHHGWSQCTNNCEEEKLNKDRQLVLRGEANSSQGYVSGVDPQPIADPVWRGSLHLFNQSFGTITGLLVHLSNLACSKVLKETRCFPNVLCADLLQRSAVWPRSFIRGGPKYHNIALYLFPENESVERTFDGLVDDMITDDLAIRAVVENAELLVFPSTVLPTVYRRFQAKYYLWGVFKAKQGSPETNDAISEDYASDLTKE